MYDRQYGGWGEAAPVGGVLTLYAPLVFPSFFKLGEDGSRVAKSKK